ncbi:MAG: hypothetical protein IPO06_17090 [Leptospiraceae bacterium]|nr:hypothetical protein [Leptospiraceae bacterium]
MYKLILILLLAFLNSCSSPLNPFAKEKEDNSMLIAAGAIATQSSRGGSVATQTTVGLTTGTVASIGTPYDWNTQDVVGPTDHYTNYGTAPQFALHSNTDGTLDIAWQNQDDKTKVVITKLNSAFASVGHLQVTSLGALGGYTKDDTGNSYIMTAKTTDIGDAPSPDNTARAGIVALAKISSSNSVSFTTDLKANPANNTSGIDLIHIFNPMTAGSSRIQFGNGIVLSFFAKNTGYDSSISRRHQNAVVTTVQTADGVEINGKNAYSHSFDQRIIYDASNKRFVTLELGDAYDRAIGLSTYSVSGTTGTRKPFKVFLIKGTLGQNYTYTRLGGVVNTASGYLVLFSTEKETTVPSGLGIYPMNLALVRMTKTLAVAESSTGNANYDSTFSGVDTQAVTSNSKSVTNRGIKWLTSYTSIATGSAERPRIVQLSDASIIVLWEEWKVASSASSYLTTKAMLIDADGNTVKSETDLGKVHIGRGDDIIPICSSAGCLEAGWVTGDKTNKTLKLYKVDKNLILTTTVIK